MICVTSKNDHIKKMGINGDLARDQDSNPFFSNPGIKSATLN
jgi:hypothetical protein